jgi:transposase
MVDRLKGDGHGRSGGTLHETGRAPRHGGGHGPGAGQTAWTRRGETRTFATTIAGLERMADWLLGEHAVTLVGMEATGVYWKPVFAVLEPRVECWLLNAQHLHNVPGRKTDVADSVWIAQLIEHGLVRPSFVPPAPVRGLRDVTRLRTGISQERLPRAA